MNHDKWKKFLSEAKMADLGAEQKYVAKIGSMKVLIDIEDADLVGTKQQRKTVPVSHDRKISNEAIINAVELALGKVINDFAMVNFENNEPFVIRAVSKGKGTDLNVVAALDMKKGPDSVKVVTVMRKNDLSLTIEPTRYILDDLPD